MRIKFFTILSLLLIGATGFYIKQFKIDASSNSLLSGGNEIYYNSLKAYYDFNLKNTTLIAYRGNGPNIFNKENLSFVSNFIQEVKRIEYVKDVSSILSTPIFFNLTNFDGDIKNNSIQNLNIPLSKIRKELKNHPLYENVFYNKKQDTLGILVEFHPSLELSNIEKKILPLLKKELQKSFKKGEKKKLKELKNKKFHLSRKLDIQSNEAIKEIRKITEKYKGRGEFYLGGTSTVNYQLVNIIRNDLIYFGIAIIIIMGIFIYSVYRDILIATLPLITCLLSVFLTIGFLGLLELSVTVISANVLALQVILTLVVCVHLTEALRSELEIDPEDLMQSKILRALKEKFAPCMYAGATTLIGFGSLIISDIKPIHSFGLMMCFVVTLSLYSGLIIYPLLLNFFYKRKKIKVYPKYFDNIKNIFIKLCERHARIIILVNLGVLVGGGLLSLRLSTDQSFLNYFAKDTKVYEELSFIDKNMGGTTTLDLIYTIPLSERKKDLKISAKTVQKIKLLQERMEENPFLSGVTSVIDFLRIGKKVNSKPLTEYELTAIYDGLDQHTRQEVLGQLFNPDLHKLRITSRVLDSSEGLQREKLNKDIEQYAKQSNISTESYSKTNLFFIYEDILRRLIDTQVYTMSLVYIAMLLFLTIVFKSFKLALICILPNIVTTSSIFGVMSLFNIHLDIMTITIASVVMGISVDDTVHYTHLFRKGNSLQKNRISSTTNRLGTALIFTSLVIFCGFSSLGFSDFIPGMIFGLLTAIGMIIALIIDLTLLPVLLIKYQSK